MMDYEALANEQLTKAQTGWHPNHWQTGAVRGLIGVGYALLALRDAIKEVSKPEDELMLSETLIDRIEHVRAGLKKGTVHRAKD